jgi:hypothetical protein
VIFLEFKLELSPGKTVAPSGSGRTTAARKPAAANWNSTTACTASTVAATAPSATPSPPS